MKYLIIHSLFLLPVNAVTAAENRIAVDSLQRNAVVTLPESLRTQAASLGRQFLLYLPRDYDAEKRAPLMIFLHGKGQRGNRIDAVAEHGIPKLIEEGHDFPFVVVAPQCRVMKDGKGYWNPDDLDRLLVWLKQNRKIDEDRIYLTGLSMGGYGTWAWAISRPKTFAAIAPVCGGAHPMHAWKIAAMPVWAFHGAKDDVVRLRASKRIVDALKVAGADVKFTVYPETKHDSWKQAYRTPELYDWFLEKTATANRIRKPAPVISPETIEDATRQLQVAVESGKVAGASHLVKIGGRTAFLEGAGVCDIENGKPFTTDTMLRIYSMSKPITSVAAMTLFEQRKFQLDDPISKFIPAFEKTSVLVQDGDKITTVPAKRQITVRDVFRHTTGYSYGEGKPSPLKFYVKEGMRYHGPAHMFPPKITIEKAAEALARIPALHHPGERFTYGFSTDLLGRLIEVWSQLPLDEYLQQSVLEPLQMSDTAFVVPERKRARLASCHTRIDGKLAVIDKASASPFTADIEFQSGGGGLVSTINDYSRFCQMLVNGGEFAGHRLLKQDTVDLMFTDQLREVPGSFQFGLGFAIKQIEIGSGKSKRKVMQYSWGGYASTDFRLVPEEELFQIFMRQHVPSSHALAGKLFAVIYEGIQ